MVDTIYTDEARDLILLIGTKNNPIDLIGHPVYADFFRQPGHGHSTFFSILDHSNKGLTYFADTAYLFENVAKLPKGLPVDYLTKLASLAVENKAISTETTKVADLLDALAAKIDGASVSLGTSHTFSKLLEFDATRGRKIIHAVLKTATDKDLKDLAKGPIDKSIPDTHKTIVRGLANDEISDRLRTQLDARLNELSANGAVSQSAPPVPTTPLEKAEPAIGVQ